MQHSLRASVLIDQTFALGEGPVWDHERARLLWTDITAGELWQWSPGETHRRIYSGDTVGGFTLQRDGSLIVFRSRDIAHLDDAGVARSIAPFDNADAERFNDVIAAPDGSVFAGTIGAGDTSGGLYHVARSGASRQLFLGMKVANGMGFTADQRTFYFTDSTARTITAFDHDPRDAAITNPRVLLRAGEGDHTPDGMTVDAEGCIWSARWGGARVVRHAPDTGAPRGVVETDSPDTTAVAIGGPDGRTMYITSAGGPIYTATAPAAGMPEHRSALEL